MNELTELELQQEWITPYNYFSKGDKASVEYWANKLGKEPQELINDIEADIMVSWFKVVRKKSNIKEFISLCDEYEIPRKESDVFKIGDELLMELFFNITTYDNPSTVLINPVVTLTLNNMNNTEVFSVGEFKCDETLEPRSMKKLIATMKSVRSGLKHYASRFSLSDLNENTFFVEVSKILERNDFFI